MFLGHSDAAVTQKHTHAVKSPAAEKQNGAKYWKAGTEPASLFLYLNKMSVFVPVCCSLGGGSTF